MIDKIFNIKSEEEFASTCLEVFLFQSAHCAVYRDFVGLLGISPASVTSLESIPFLPIELFKSKEVVSDRPFIIKNKSNITFTSSSTSGMIPSKHIVSDVSIYQESFYRGFRLFYGDPSQYAILALLPSYLERKGSSLVYMAEALIKASGDKRSGFYLYDFDSLYNALIQLKGEGKKTLLLGVSFALLDFAKKYKLQSSPDWELILMETGGMKGRGEEISRELLHSKLMDSFGVRKVNSEYGMCELLSQAYSSGDGVFKFPPWGRVVVRDPLDPSRQLPSGERGPINIIDLANLNSCSFIATQDIGKNLPSGEFTVEGRLSNAQRRGCNMLLE